MGTGVGKNNVVIVPSLTVVEEGSVLEMDTSQLGGVDKSTQKTSGKIGKDARLIVRKIS